MSANLNKIAYKPVGLLLGVAAGALAGALFKQAWKLAGRDDDAPHATDEDRGWGEILAAAALQGAIFAVVKAAVDRGGAVGVRRLTGEWPD
jgi:predicted metal-dependent enzyme (double-stranded beta helix superfamily)